MDENFGTNPDEKKEFSMKPTSRFSKKFTNAYMLVYIRESDLSDVSFFQIFFFFFFFLGNNFFFDF